MSAAATTSTKPAVELTSADSEVRAAMKDQNTSALRKYMALTLGKDSLLSLAKFELLTLMLTNLPGALGMVMRQKLYKHMFRACGRGVVIGRGVTIRHPHRISLGDHVVVDDHAVLDGKGDADATLTVGEKCIVGRNSILSCKAGTITLESNVNISVNCTIISETSLTIGADTLIAGHCYIIAGGNHSFDRVDLPIVDQPMIQKGGVSIGQGCWLGANVTVLDGVTMGEGVVAAAGAVVNKPVEAFKVVAGLPAKVLRDRHALAAARPASSEG